MNETKQLVKAILQSPYGLKWSVQGLGMMRTYLSPELRLHIWDSSLKVPNVSPIHDHPWHFKSTVVAGRLRNQTFRLIAPPREYGYEELQMSTILCGENACTVSDPEKVWARRMQEEIYYEGMDYSQFRDEIHESLPDDGTVTLVRRTFIGDRDHARVFWRGDGPWVDAKPRQATGEEVSRVTQGALNAWFQ